MERTRRSNPSGQLLLAAGAAFCTYFCMYAFRKPFTAATFEGQEILGYGLKTVLVISQIIGYMTSKFIGIKVVSETRREHRAVGILGLIFAAEAALVGFAYAPLPLKPVMLFFNGLPLGMVFGLVLAHLEGRVQTEALSAALCASFVMSSGVVKSVGRWLVLERGVSEFQMPMITGLIFVVPLLFSVWVLQRTPPPDGEDVRLRRERSTMSREQRRAFFNAYWPGLSLFVLVYVALTVVRTVRDDFAVEIWRDMGVRESPSVFATSETLVAICVTALNAVAIWIRNNQKAMWMTVGLMCGAFALSAAASGMQSAGLISPYVFMVTCGIGLYVPYIAFHTTIFERLIAASRRPGNLGFLMYVADATGYFGYALVMILKANLEESKAVLPFFLAALWIVAAGSILALLVAVRYFRRVLPSDEDVGSHDVASPNEDPVQAG